MTFKKLFENEHEDSLWGMAGSLDRIADALEAIHTRVTQEPQSGDKIDPPGLTGAAGIDEWMLYTFAVIPDKDAAQVVMDYIFQLERTVYLKTKALERRPWTRDQVRNAVNSACECGGNGPGSCCAACEVWHSLNGASE